ncbi:unnamed protein product [Rhizophagus irregularis]|nr:unnamed protein product [Rhizophagus irregularis]
MTENKDVRTVPHPLQFRYKESYLARTKGSVIHHANKQMYRKWLDTFSITRSKNASTAKAQEIRFYRACRQTFHAKEHNSFDTMRHRLITAQRYQFLFLPSQYIYKPIKHLLYTHGLDYPDYGFRIPYNQDITSEKDILVHTVEQYNPIPAGFFPSKYKDIIPKDPLYTPAEKAKVALHGTTAKHFDRRDQAKKWHSLRSDYYHQNMSKFTSEYNMMEGHTKFQLQLHEEMTAFNDAFNLGKRISVVTPTMNNELYIPYRGGSFYVDNLSQVDYKAVTSDDTKEIERRPYKHLTTTTCPLTYGQTESRGVAILLVGGISPITALGSEIEKLTTLFIGGISPGVTDDWVDQSGNPKVFEFAEYADADRQCTTYFACTWWPGTVHDTELDKMPCYHVVEDMTKPQDRRDLQPSINSQHENKLAHRTSSPATEIKTEHGEKDDATDLPADLPPDQKDLRYLPRNSILSRTCCSKRRRTINFVPARESRRESYILDDKEGEQRRQTKRKTEMEITFKWVY